MWSRPCICDHFLPQYLDRRQAADHHRLDGVGSDRVLTLYKKGSCEIAQYEGNTKRSFPSCSAPYCDQALCLSAKAMFCVVKSSSSAEHDGKDF